MYRKSITFNLPVNDYESLRDLAHRTRGTITELLCQGALLILEKRRSENGINVPELTNDA